MHDEYAVVDTYSEYEGGDDDADEIETDSKQVHRSQNNEPAEQNGGKGYEGVSEIFPKKEIACGGTVTKRKQQNEKYEDH